MDYEKLMEKARATNAKRDNDDRLSGAGAPEDHGAWALLVTAIDAIKAGVVRDDWNAIAEGQAMLERIVDKYQPVKMPRGFGLHPRVKGAEGN